jgi:hypothetical protein
MPSMSSLDMWSSCAWVIQSSLSDH